MDTSKQTLKEKCEAMKASTNYTIESDTYVVLHLDGKNFSTMAKKYFRRPFDYDVICAMDETMQYLMANIQGALVGYTQSDEITVIMSDKSSDPNVKTSPFFGYRLNKIQSICASMCGAKFNRIMFKNQMDMIQGCMLTEDYKKRLDEIYENAPLYVFDCKAFPAKEANDAYAWLLYRQRDCIRNSRAQLAQHYIPHKALQGLTSDQQIALLKDQKGIDWHTDFGDGIKYGRYCVHKVQCVSGVNGEYTRGFWEIIDAKPADNTDFKECIMSNITRHENNKN